jgi:hypothetical protein
MEKVKIIKDQCPICDVQFMAKILLTGEPKKDCNTLRNINYQLNSCLKAHIKRNECVIVY